MIRKSFAFIFATILTLSVATSTASAANAGSFQAGRIIDDIVFTDTTTMSVNDIQNFLNSKVPSCNSNHAAFTGSTGTVYSPQFICLKDFYENPSSSYTVSLLLYRHFWQPSNWIENLLFKQRLSIYSTHSRIHQRRLPSGLHTQRYRPKRKWRHTKRGDFCSSDYLQYRPSIQH